jgi:hypothetical protein
MYSRQRAKRMQILWLRRVHARIALRHHHNGLLLAQRIDQLDRALSSHRQRQYRMGEQHRIPHRQDRQHLDIAHFPLIRVAGLNHANKIASH